MKKIYSLLLLAVALACLPMGVKAETLGPLYDGTNTYGSYVPVEGGNADRYQHVQVIYPKDDLTALAGKNITSLTFYLSSSAQSAWTSTFEIRLGTTSSEYFATTTYLAPEDLTLVYTGTLDATGSTMVITFDDPFTYSGTDNLLFDLLTKETGSVYKSAKFSAKGGYDYNYSMYGSPGVSTPPASANSRKPMRPKTLFTYEEAGSASCAKPVLTPGDVTAKTAAFSWTAGGEETSWQYVCLPATEKVNWEGVPTTTNTSATVESLAANTAYKFYLRAYCGAEDQSGDVTSSFTTLKSCYEPTNLSVTNETIEGATISWSASGKGETQYQYTYAVYGGEANWENATMTSELSATLSGLNSATPYQVWVRSYCGAEDQSEAITQYFTTLVDCSAKALPLNEDFSDEDNLACWKMVDCNSSTGVSSGKFQFQYTKTPPQYLISPELIASAKQVKVEFDYWCYSSSDEESFQVGYSTTTNETDAFTWGTEYKTTNTSSASPDEFSEVLPAGIKFIAIKCTSDYKYYLYIDNFSATEYEAPACPAISALEASEIGINSAKLSWTKGGEETAWKLQTSADGESWNEAVDVTENPYTLAGLTAKTTYYVRVAANCGSEVSEWSKAINFTTDCAAQDLLSESFSSTLPECWKVSKTGGDYGWAPSSSYKVSASYSMNYYATASTEYYADLTTPLVNLGDKETQLTFQLKNDSYYGQVVGEVYIVVEGAETKIYDLPSTSGFALQTVDLSAYVGKEAKFIFRAHGAGTYKNIYIDDVAIDVIPCATPTGLAAVQGNASATLTWTDENADKWNLRYRIVKAEEPYNEWIEVKDITEKTKEISGLTNGSEYEAQVQAACSVTRTSDWTASVKFTPEDCPNVTSVSFGAQTYNSIVVNWATSSASNCDVRYKAGEGDWTTVSNIAETTKTLTGLTTGAIYTVQVKPSCGNADSWVAAAETYTPAYSTPANAAVASITDNGVSASWEAVADAPNGYKYIVVAKDAEPTWASATATNELSAALANLDAAVEYDFYVAAVYGEILGDAAKVSFKTVTVAPKNFTQVAISATSATYSWEKEGANTTFEYSLDGEAWTAVAENQVVLNGLTGNTAYTLYVRSVYAGELRSANASVTFRTECAAVSALTWTKGNFEEETGLAAPRCWTVYTPNEYPYVNTWYPHAGSYHLWFQNGGSAGKEQIAALPEFTEDIKTLKMSFYYHNSNYTSSSYPSLEVGVMSDLNDSASFRALVVLDKISKYGTQPTEVLFSKATASEKYIAFRLAGGTYDGRATIDDITFSAAPTCFAPELGATTILPDGATFTWTAGNGETNFQYAIDTTETLVWKATDATEATIHGLVPGNNYKFYVRAFCDPEVGDSVWTAFAPVCNAPTEAALTAATTNTASFSWTAAANITTYQYVVMAKGVAADWSKAKTTDNTIAEWTELAAGTAYDFYVRSYYSESVQSAAASVSFRTACAAITALPWSENFEDQTLNAAPACWEVVDPNNTNIYVSTGSTWFTLGTTGLFFEGAKANYGYILLPEFEVALNTLQISFSHSEEHSSYSGKIELGYYKDNEFTSLKAYDQSQKAWKAEGPFALTDVPAGARLAFGYKTNSNAYAAAIDNITIEEIPSCAVPTDLAASEVTAATATLSWTSEAVKFKVQYTTDKDNWGEEHEVEGTSYPINGLTEHTTYYAHVKAVCSEESESEYCEEISFTTSWAAQSYPYAYSFGETLDARWSVVDNHGSNTWTMSSEDENYFAQYKTTSNSYNHSVLQTPEVTIPSESDPYLIFNWRNTGASAEVKISVNGAAAVVLDADFNTELSTVTGTWALKKVSLAAYKGQTVRILFNAISGTANKYAELDEVRFDEKPCLVPTDLKASATEGGASITWTAAWDETSWNLQYKKTSEDAEHWQLIENVTENPYNLSGLTYNVEYEVQIQAICGENVSEWSASATFTPTKSTGMDELNGTESVGTKIMENGVLYIIRDGIKYNAQGARVMDN